LSTVTLPVSHKQTLPLQHFTAAQFLLIVDFIIGQSVLDDGKWFMASGFTYLSFFFKN